MFSTFPCETHVNNFLSASFLYYRSNFSNQSRRNFIQQKPQVKLNLLIRKDNNFQAAKQAEQFSIKYWAESLTNTQNTAG